MNRRREGVLQARYPRLPVCSPANELGRPSGDLGALVEPNRQHGIVAGTDLQDGREVGVVDAMPSDVRTFAENDPVACP